MSKIRYMYLGFFFLLRSRRSVRTFFAGSQYPKEYLRTVLIPKQNVSVAAGYVSAKERGTPGDPGNSNVTLFYGYSENGCRHRRQIKGNWKNTGGSRLSGLLWHNVRHEDNALHERTQRLSRLQKQGKKLRMINFWRTFCRILCGEICPSL